MPYINSAPVLMAHRQQNRRTQNRRTGRSSYNSSAYNSKYDIKPDIVHPYTPEELERYRKVYDSDWVEYLIRSREKLIKEQEERQRLESSKRIDDPGAPMKEFADNQNKGFFSRMFKRKSYGGKKGTRKHDKKTKRSKKKNVRKTSKRY